MKVNKCCVCVPLDLAVKILGALDLLMWLSAASNGDIFKFTLLLASCLTFTKLMLADSYLNRLNFFFAFAAYRVVLLALFGYNCWLDFAEEPVEDEKKAVQNVCTQI